MATFEIPPLDIESLVKLTEDDELVKASRDKTLLDVQESVNRLLAKIGDNPDARDVGVLLKILIAPNMSAVTLGGDALAGAVHILKLLWAKCQTEEGAEYLTQAKGFMDDLSKDDSEMWKFLVPIAKVLVPVLKDLKEGLDRAGNNDERQSIICKSVADFTKAILTKFPMPTMETLPEVEVPGLGGTLRLYDLSVPGIAPGSVPSPTTAGELSTSIPRLGYTPAQEYTMVVSDLSLEAHASFERKGASALKIFGAASYTSNALLRADGCQLRVQTTLKQADGVVLIDRVVVDKLEIGSWTVERAEGDAGKCRYLGGSYDGQEFFGFRAGAAKLAVDTGLKALSQVPQTLLNAVRPQIDEEVNQNLLPHYIAQANEMIQKVWPMLAGSTTAGQAGPSGTDAPELAQVGAKRKLDETLETLVEATKKSRARM